MNKIEILAPAGSIESLQAAVNAGADAVYIGGSLFGARAYANNLEKDALLRAIDYVHLRGKHIYLTVNTLLKNNELMEGLFSYLTPFYMEGLDAVIVQDVGVMNFIHRNFPELPIHLSTQMTLTMAEGLEIFKDMGVTRIVTSRELSLQEIRRIRKNTSLEIETFVHGALCYCYSGQCLMSSMIGGRSGNRGRCAQPCRMEYDVKEKDVIVSKKGAGYVLSPKDICTLDSVADFIETGINSFKIEGRMKRYEYVAGVVESYRKQVDLYYEMGREGYQAYKEKNPKMISEAVLRLQDLYNRGGFCGGYFQTHNGKQMMSMYRPNHSGVEVGKIVAIQGINASIKLTEDINEQDILEIRNSGNKVYEFTRKDSAKKGQTIQAKFLPGSKVTIGNNVFRTKNDKLLTELSEGYLENEKKIPISGILQASVSKPLEFIVSVELENEKHIEIKEYGNIVEAAMKQPMTKEKIEAQLMKTNETPFVFKELKVNLEGDIFLPVSKLNKIRRSALVNLEKAMISSYLRVESKEKAEELPKDMVEETQRVKINELSRDRTEETFIDKKKSIPGLIASCKNITQVESACSFNAVDEIYWDLAENDFSTLSSVSEKVKRCGKGFYIVFPPIFRADTYDLFYQNKEFLMTDNIDGYVVKNYEEIAFVKGLLKEYKEKEVASKISEFKESKEIRLDHNVYVMNEEAKQFYLAHEISKFTASVELNYNELNQLGMSNMDLIVYGYLPVMISAQCIKKNTDACRKQANGNSLVLIDRMNNHMKVRTNCRECYNTIYNAKCLSLLNETKDILRLQPANIRLDFTFETAEEVKEVISEFVAVYVSGKEPQKLSNDYTKGHFRRGIL